MIRRTTVLLEEDLYRQMKRRAVDRGTPVRRLVEDALKSYLGINEETPTSHPLAFGVYQGRIVGSLRREDLYREHLLRKIR
jgi:hypothetical protein